jgi:pilus assembly protein FimV
MPCRLLNSWRKKGKLKAMNMPKTARQLLLLPLLCLAALPAWAVSLGQLQLQSGLGQPLLAQIPIYDADQAEINSLYVHLASEEAFKRLGIDRRLYRDIQIRIVSNEDGQAFVELSTEQPFDEPVFNVLLDANWRDGGRLVKELTALVDPPFIANAAVQTIEAPTVALTPVVAAPVLATSPPVTEVPSAKTAPVRPEPEKVTETRTPPKVAAKPSAKQAPAPAAKPVPSAPIPSIPATATNQRTVQNNESLYVIALDRNTQLPATRVSLNQMMRAIQRANPEAFINGDANRLKRGSVLRLPDEQQVRALLPEDSAGLLAGQWSRKVQAQPAPVLGAANKLNQKSAAAPTRTAAPVVNQGRLKIVPTVGAMNNAGSQSGASKSGQGSELRAENAATQEELAAKQAEISNLRTQLDQAGKSQAESQRLIELQNTQIKQLTQRMQEMKAKGVQTANSPVAESAAKPATESAWYFSPYAVFAALLLIAGLLGVLLKRKR